MERYHAILQDCFVPAAFVLLLVNVSLSQDTNRSVSGDSAGHFSFRNGCNSINARKCIAENPNGAQIQAVQEVRKELLHAKRASLVKRWRGVAFWRRRLAKGRCAL